MRHGIVILPEERWRDAARRWSLAEEYGFDHAWTYDHLMWRWLREETWFGCVPTLTAAATVTSRVMLGTLVATPGFRHPVTLAKDLMALDDVSGGRIVCGMGSGAGGYDELALGGPRLTPGERVGRFAEFLELTDLLLRQPETTYHGRHYTAEAVHMRPGCARRPRMPLAVAATGPRSMRLAARFADTWITAGPPGRFDAARYDRVLPDLGKQVDAVEKACAATGRDPATLDRLLVTGAAVGGVLDSVEAFRDATGRFAELGFTDVVVHWPRPSFPYEGRPEVLEEIAREVLLPDRAAAQAAATRKGEAGEAFTVGGPDV
ncbi:LLM class flavin-dependent oxidoreductase [Streptomyces sp. ICBB 8177]|uniref:LLM class flavin-dependent oxidoreductase n=1 Tax=Streptomyces sp. ICBB 8177 TaxID=563922 RepID=UPI000D684E6D|nr:LLM class flavin-dependent oxidoreductase [Streptomyces sp. ICBB 8177]PWI42283.1 LLM class flavin-dependent oxidoreductase [Streptomyces sp. ICBB 8177]